MTDEELSISDATLIERLRDWPYQGETMAGEAADRIEQLVVAGRAYREATRHFKPCPETSANFDTALKGEGHE